jgi:prophage regulatory protein
MTTSIHQLPETGFLRINQIVNVPGKATPPLIPVSRSSWLAGVKSGKYPQPVKLGERTTAWKAEDIRALIVQLGGVA